MKNGKEQAKTVGPAKTTGPAKKTEAAEIDDAVKTDDPKMEERRTEPPETSKDNRPAENPDHSAAKDALSDTASK